MRYGDDRELPASGQARGDQAVDEHALAAARGARGQEAGGGVEVELHIEVGLTGPSQPPADGQAPDPAPIGVEGVGDRGREGRQLTGADPHGQGRGVRPQVPAGTADDRGDRLAEPGVVPRGHVARRQVDVEAAAVRAAHPHLPRPDPQGGGQGLTGAQLVGVEAPHGRPVAVRVETDHDPPLAGMAGLVHLGEQRRLSGPISGLDRIGQGHDSLVVDADDVHLAGEVGPALDQVDADQAPGSSQTLAESRGHRPLVGL